MLTAFGRWILNIILTTTDLVQLIFQAVRDIPLLNRQGLRPIFRVYLKQIYFTGLEALKIIVIMSLAIGTVIITQIISLGGSGNESLIGKILIWVVIRELGPLLTAIIIVARSGTAIAAELGTMKINGELESLESLGIPVSRYLIMPRVFGVTTAVIILTGYFEIVSIMGGFAVAAIGWHIPFERFTAGVFSSLTGMELAMSFSKSMLFGLFLTAACCRQGLSVGKSATQIPQAATKGVMQSLFLVFLLDGMITLLFSLI